MSARDAAKIPKRIQSIKFGLLEPNEIRKMSAVEVKTADTYRDDGHIQARIDGSKNGCNRPRCQVRNLWK